MNIKINLEKSKVDYSKIVPLRENADKALDLLWSGKKEEYKWVKMPMNFDKDVIDNLDKAGILIGGRCGMIVIVGDQKTVNTVRNVISALPESGGFPTCLFVDETLSAKAMERVLLQCRQNEIVVIAVSEETQSKAAVANLKILENFVKERYEEKNAKSHLYFVIGAADSPYRRIAEKGGYSTITNTDIFEGEEGVLSPAVLLPMACVGYSIEDFIKGAEDMLSDPAWDNDLADWAICQALGAGAANACYDEELFYMAGINGQEALLFPADEGLAYEDDFLTLVEVDENDVDILLPNSEEYEEESLREIMNKEKEAKRDKFSACISLDRLDAYNAGQLVYFLLLSQAIRENL